MRARILTRAIQGLRRELTKQVVCEVLRRESSSNDTECICVNLPLLSPDGDYITVFVDIADRGKGWRVSDGGNLCYFLASAGEYIGELSPEQQAALAEIVGDINAELVNGEIVATVTPPNMLSFACFQVGQAIAVALNVLPRLRRRSATHN